MALLRASNKLTKFLNSSSYRNSNSLPLFCRHFSTANEQPPNPSPHFDPFGSPQGAVYARLVGINENTLKTDVINLFEASNLTLDDIKVEYDRMFNPLAMLVQFPSLSEYTAAIRENSRKGRIFRLDQTDRQYWDAVIPYEGNNVLLHGIPRMANMDDVERFLSGCNYDSLEIFTRAAYPDTIRMAKVRFSSHIGAMNAVIQKNGSFCLNTRIAIRYVQ